jgi:hypothetical protein
VGFEYVEQLPPKAPEGDSEVAPQTQAAPI